MIGFDIADQSLAYPRSMPTIAAVRALLDAKAGASESYPFGPGAAVFKVGSKIFALVSDAGGTVSLKGDPDDNVALRKMYPAVTAGYHLNKKHWNTVVVADVPADEVTSMIDLSYDLVVASLPRKLRDTLAS